MNDDLAIRITHGVRVQTSRTRGGCPRLSHALGVPRR